MRIAYLIAICCLLSCKDRTNQEGSIQDLVQPSTLKQGDLLPQEFEELISVIIDQMPDETKKIIKESDNGDDMIDHFGMGLSLRNGDLNRTDSEVRLYLIRQGIYHRDDLSSIVLYAVNRRLRGEPVELAKKIQYYRSYWEAQDTVAPLDLNCPTCKKELNPAFWGGTTSHPDRNYFWGRCPDEHDFLYYHKEGWIPQEN
ncbi:hypothetical protein HW115_18575 [Verrucomicrobiaceae bacterium N1E253]|uniref:DUF6794 domain-containing protein n=1 Tax=Oceaniferula marina TaxID=2748318 RepID=A0A851GKF8_9BACT|nr:DUF6794 domain-containing protein [Oceaniferula marina]NWK57629.1 hypothetical protein [Oceaniferula marina]